jgi:hypothetical protein
MACLDKDHNNPYIELILLQNMNNIDEELLKYIRLRLNE